MGIKTIRAKSTNTKPIANAGPNREAIINDYVYLNGRASTDADGDSLTYLWRIISQPVGSNKSLSGANTVVTKFFPPKTGDYVIGLIVSDSLVQSDECSVTVTAVQNNTAIETIIENSSVTVTPNPVNNKLYIQYNLLKKGTTTIKLYTLSGQQIYSNTIENQSAGSHKIEINNNHLFEIKGVSILELTLNQTQIIKKIVIH